MLLEAQLLINGSLVSNPFRTGRYCAVFADEYQGNQRLKCFKPLQNGAVLCCCSSMLMRLPMSVVSNPFRTGRYCADREFPVVVIKGTMFQTPSERGGIVLVKSAIADNSRRVYVSNPFRTGRYCADPKCKFYSTGSFEFQTPSERGGIVLKFTGTDIPGIVKVFQTPSERGGIVLLFCVFPEKAWGISFKPLQNGAVLCWSRSPARTRPARSVSNPFRTGRYCAAGYLVRPAGTSLYVSNPFRTGRYCAGSARSSSSRARFCFKPLQNGAVLC